MTVEERAPAALERAHAVDEYVETADLEALARTLFRVIARF